MRFMRKFESIKRDNYNNGGIFIIILVEFDENFIGTMELNVVYITINLMIKAKECIIFILTV